MGRMQLTLDAFDAASQDWLVQLTPRRRMSRAEYVAFVETNPDLRIERTADGEVIVMPAAHSRPGPAHAKMPFANEGCAKCHCSSRAAPGGLSKSGHQAIWNNKRTQLIILGAIAYGFLNRHPGEGRGLYAAKSDANARSVDRNVQFLSVWVPAFAGMTTNWLRLP